LRVLLLKLKIIFVKATTIIARGVQPKNRLKIVVVPADARRSQNVLRIVHNPSMAPNASRLVRVSAYFARMNLVNGYKNTKRNISAPLVNLLFPRLHQGVSHIILLAQWLLLVRVPNVFARSKRGILKRQERFVASLRRQSCHQAIRVCVARLRFSRLQTPALDSQGLILILTSSAVWCAGRRNHQYLSHQRRQRFAPHVLLLIAVLRAK
jgi:hypothetical protein